VVFLPAKTDSGIRFVRSDLSGKPAIYCKSANQQPSLNCTTLKSGDATISVVEHLLAACAVLGVTNLLIEVDGPEMPTLDGSATGYAEAFLKAGLESQDSAIRELSLNRPLLVEDGDSAIVAIPSDTLCFSYMLDYSKYPEIGCDYVTVNPDSDNLLTNLLPARTFIAERDALAAVKSGVIKSTDESMGLIIRSGVKPELRMSGEFARHKILDLIGDLHVLGKTVRAHYVGIRSGHKLNSHLVRALAARFP
jgi:UDP-3-O-acyl N-acetylglucosamine deacetylase